MALWKRPGGRLAAASPSPAGSAGAGPESRDQDGGRPAGRLVLHLGDFKTGTTAIQSWLRNHGAAHGIATPPGLGQPWLAQSLIAPDPAAGDAAWAGLARDLAPDPAADPTPDLPSARPIVLSAEHFEMSPPWRVAEMLARHLPDLAGQARLIVYIRPHPAAYLARFAESVKIGSHMGGLDGYLTAGTQRRMAYGTRLTAWAAVFGDRLTVRLFDPALFPGGDVVRDFAAFVTGRDPGPQQDLQPQAPSGSRANPTPGLRDLARARALHAAIGPLPPAAMGARFTLGRAYGRLLAAAAAQDGPDIPLRLHRDLARKLQEVFAREAALAEDRFLPGSPLTRALQKAVDDADEAAPVIDPATVLDRAALAEINRLGALLQIAFASAEGAAMIDRLWHE